MALLACAPDSESIRATQTAFMADRETRPTYTAAELARYAETRQEAERLREATNTATGIRLAQEPTATAQARINEARARSFNRAMPNYAAEAKARAEAKEERIAKLPSWWGGETFKPKPRPCEWKMSSLNDDFNPRSPGECHDGSLHYSLEDMEQGEDGRWDLPDHHPAHFVPAPSPTPTP